MRSKYVVLGETMTGSLSLNEILIFVIGRPGSGKSTFARYLSRALADPGVLSLNDYELLLQRTKTLTPGQIRREANGEFEVLDRAIFDTLVDDLAKAAIANKGKRLTIIEFARGNYVESFSRMANLGLHPGIIVYVDAPLETCVRRNAARAPNYPIKTVPEAVIRRYYAEDDLPALFNTYPGHVRVVDNVPASLHALEREAVLVVAELLGREAVEPLSSSALRKELCAAGILAMYLAAFAALAVAAWRAASQSLLSNLAPTVESIPMLRTVALVVSAGGLGSTTYCIRALYHYYIQGVFDFDRFKWWYVFRPIAGGVLALSTFAIVQGGVVVIGASSSAPRANLAWFGIAYLAGFGTEQVIEWLRRASKSIFGESRVQPDDHSQDAR